jgi:hypothetical protein
MFDTVAVFTGTRARERDGLGDKATAWLREHPEMEVVDKEVRLSSDAEFHCLTIVLFCKNRRRRSHNG